MKRLSDCPVQRLADCRAKQPLPLAVQMLKAIDRAKVATAIRAAMASSRVFLTPKSTEDLQIHLMDHLNRLSVEIEPPKTVPQSEHELLQMKYNTALQLLEIYRNANSGGVDESQVGERCRCGVCQGRVADISRMAVPTGT